LALLAASEGLCRTSGSFEKARFQAEYRRILGLYAVGDPENALSGLVAVESAWTTDPDQVGRLRRAKRGVIKGLLRSNIDTLIPIVLLHQEAYLAYRSQGLYSLAVHSRSMAAELAEEYASRVEEGDGRRLASDLLAGLAGHAIDAAMEMTGADLYDRALRIDPENREALASLAAIFERYGAYRKAVPLLERLLRIEPGHSEARLRLGINLARLGRRLSAANELRQLLEVDEADWTLSVAYQELARLLARQGELALARSLLMQAVERLPCDANLPIQLSYYADRSATRDSESDLAEALRRCAGRRDSSPRFAYSELPKGALELRRQRLQRLLASKLPVLADALSVSLVSELGS
jgi:tetratricopeptide (TPR) repeat protein